MGLEDRHFSYQDVIWWAMWILQELGDVDGQSLTQRIQDPRTAGRAEAEKIMGPSDLSGPREVKKSEESDCNTE